MAHQEIELVGPPASRRISPRMAFIKRHVGQLLGLAAAVCVMGSGIGEAVAANCSGTSVGLPPLTDLALDEFQGSQGGLYPGGKNYRPLMHESAGRVLAERIAPRDHSGAIDLVDGKIAFISVGMSNTRSEFGRWVLQAAADPAINDQLVFINGAKAGKAALSWIDPDGQVWADLDGTLSAAGLSPLQVQVGWVKLAEPSFRGPLTFPERPVYLQQLLHQIVRIARSRYPNLELLFLSSRIYGGYATTDLSPEPYAFYGGFAVKWLIEAQIDGDPELNFNPLAGPVEAPWLAWGTYLWADGLGPDDAPGGIPGRLDGLEYFCEDLREDDGTHPSEAGQVKVADQLMYFFKTDSVTNSWFRPPVFADGFESGDTRSWSESFPP